jgi:hypothetical protein
MVMAVTIFPRLQSVQMFLVPERTSEMLLETDVGTHAEIPFE